MRMLRILIIDESRARAEELCGGLAMAGHQVVAVLPSALDLTAQIEAIKPDVILIETESPSRDTLENLAVMNRDMPRPVILLTQEGDAAVMRAAQSNHAMRRMMPRFGKRRLFPELCHRYWIWHARYRTAPEAATVRRYPLPLKRT